MAVIQQNWQGSHAATPFIALHNLARAGASAYMWLMMTRCTNGWPVVTLPAVAETAGVTRIPSPAMQGPGARGGRGEVRCGWMQCSG